MIHHHPILIKWQPTKMQKRPSDPGCPMVCEQVNDGPELEGGIVVEIDFATIIAELTAKAKRNKSRKARE